MEKCGAVEVQLLAFLTSALSGVEWSLSRPDRFIAKERVPVWKLQSRKNLFAHTGFYSLIISLGVG
jgi:hypothetical protein